MPPSPCKLKLSLLLLGFSLFDFVSSFSVHTSSIPLCDVPAFSYGNFYNQQTTATTSTRTSSRTSTRTRTSTSTRLFGAHHGGDVIFRPGQRQDEAVIAWKQLANLRNPWLFSSSSSSLSSPPSALSPNQSSTASRNFLVAVLRPSNSSTRDQGKNNNNNHVNNYNYDYNNDEVIVGWAQIRPLLGKGQSQRNSQRYDARPGSSYDFLQQEVDEQMWDDFLEDPNIQVPTGWVSSLPWSPEYRAMEQAVAERQARRAALVDDAERAAAEENHQANSVPLWELASLYVEPVYRGQGIGTELVRHLVDEYQATGKRRSDLYLVTDQPDFFEGFSGDFLEKVASINDIPQPMALTETSVCFRGVDRTSSIS